MSNISKFHQNNGQHEAINQLLYQRMDRINSIFIKGQIGLWYNVNAIVNYPTGMAYD